MNWRNQLKENQQQGSSYPQFLKSIDLHLEVKTDDNKVGFRYFDKTKGTNGERVSLNVPFKGILIGSAMKLSTFDSQDNSQITSSIFFSYQDQGVAFSRGKVIFKGDMKTIKEQMYDKSGDRVKNSRVYFVFTEKGSLVEISSNIGLSISDMQRLNGMDKSATINYSLVFTPTTFSFEDGDYDKKTQEALGNFARKNPPNYAKLTLDKEITDEWGERAFPFMKDYKEFEEYTKKSDEIIIEEEEESPKPQADFTPNELPKNSNPFAAKEGNTFDTTGVGKEPTDDLPF